MLKRLFCKSILLVVAAVVVVGLACSYEVRHGSLSKVSHNLWLYLSPKVKQVIVTADGPINEDEVKRVLGLQPGTPLFAYRSQTLMDRLLHYPLVQNVSLRRKLTGNIYIDLTLRKPAIVVAGDTLTFADAEGIIFKPVSTTDGVDYPVITGVSDGWVIMNDDRRRVLQQGVQLTELVQEVFKPYNYLIAEIHIDPQVGYSLITDRIQGPIVFGMPPFAHKAKRLSSLLPYLRERAANVELIDLDYRQQAFVRFKTQRQLIFAKKGG